MVWKAYLGLLEHALTLSNAKQDFNEAESKRIRKNLHKGYMGRINHISQKHKKYKESCASLDK